MKDAHDGAELAGNSIAARVCSTLAPLDGREDHARHAQATLDAFARRIAEHPVAMPMMLVAMIDALAPPRHVAIVAGSAGTGGDDAARSLPPRGPPPRGTSCSWSNERAGADRRRSRRSSRP
jgi:uncharacterized protein YyaL (SSP411 family)